MVQNVRSSEVAARVEGLSGEELLALARMAVEEYAAAGGAARGLVGLAGQVVGAAGQRALDESGSEGGDGLVRSMAAWHRLETSVHAHKLRVTGEIDRRQAWMGRAMSCAGLLVDQLGVATAEAHALVDAARAVTRMPRTAARLAAGELGAGHAADVGRAVKAYDRLVETATGQEDGQAGAPGAGASSGQGEAAGADPVAALDDHLDRMDRPEPGQGQAGGADDEAPTVVSRQRLRQVTRDWEQDRARALVAERERRMHARRSVWVGRQGGDADQIGGIRGDLTPQAVAKGRTAIHALARKHSADDRRTFAQRCHDALEQIFDIALASGRLPDVAGEQPRVLLTVSPEALRDEPSAPAPVLDGYGMVSGATARMIHCDAEVTPVVLSEGRDPLYVGRDRRRPNRAQRRAVFARDGGCIGCGAPLSQCQIHHIDWPWHLRGRTDVDRLVAVCWTCHGKIHHCGWRVTRRDDGRYDLVPPDGLDPPASGVRPRSMGTDGQATGAHGPGPGRPPEQLDLEPRASAERPAC